MEIDLENLIADVEGMTTYEELVKETLKYSCSPTVVPELKSITIGGALSGIGIESSSFRYGLVHETIKETEILLADGNVVTCNANNQFKDLFFAFPNSYGTFGYVLRVKVQLIQVKKFVKLRHLKFSNSRLYFEALQKFCLENRQTNQYAFIDGVIFEKRKCSSI